MIHLYLQSNPSDLELPPLDGLSDIENPTPRPRGGKVVSKLRSRLARKRPATIETTVLPPSPPYPPRGKLFVSTPPPSGVFAPVAVRPAPSEPELSPAVPRVGRAGGGGTAATEVVTPGLADQLMVDLSDDDDEVVVVTDVPVSTPVEEEGDLLVPHVRDSSDTAAITGLVSRAFDTDRRNGGFVTTTESIERAMTRLADGPDRSIDLAMFDPHRPVFMGKPHQPMDRAVIDFLDADGAHDSRTVRGDTVTCLGDEDVSEAVIRTACSFVRLELYSFKQEIEEFVAKMMNDFGLLDYPLPMVMQVAVESPVPGVIIYRLIARDTDLRLFAHDRVVAEGVGMIRRYVADRFFPTIRGKQCGPHAVITYLGGL